MKQTEACPNCGSLMTFAGLTVTKERVVTCSGSLTHKDPGKAEATSVPCNGASKFFVRGVHQRHIDWMPKDEEDGRSRRPLPPIDEPVWSWARCRTHGLELVRMKSARERARA